MTTLTDILLFLFAVTSLAELVTIIHTTICMKELEEDKEMLADDCVKEIERHNKLFMKLYRIENAIKNGEKEKAPYKIVLDAIKRELVKDSQSNN